MLTALDGADSWMPFSFCSGDNIVCCGWPDVAGPCCAAGSAVTGDNHGPFQNGVSRTGLGWFQGAEPAQEDAVGLLASSHCMSCWQVDSSGYLR